MFHIVPLEILLPCYAFLLIDADTVQRLTSMLLGDVPKGVVRLQIRIFPLKNKEMRARELFRLFNNCARVNYLFCASILMFCLNPPSPDTPPF